MKFKFLKKNKILLFILFFLLSIAIISLTIKSNTAITEIKKENKVLEPKPKIESTIIVQTKQKVEAKKQSPITQKDLSKISPLLTNDKIDLIDENTPLDPEPTLEIEQIMIEQKKINTFAKDKHLIEKQENWKVDYEIGLEDGAIEELKTNPTLKPGILNGKVGFSTSF